MQAHTSEYMSIRLREAQRVVHRYFDTGVDENRCDKLHVRLSVYKKELLKDAWKSTHAC